MLTGGSADEPLIGVRGADAKTFKALAKKFPVSMIARDGSIESLSGSGSVHYSLTDHRFRVTAGSFFQVNLPQAARLVELALDALNLEGGEQVLDLYSGVGLFTAALAKKGARVTAVESYAPAVEDARVNLADFSDVRFVQGLVEPSLDQLAPPMTRSSLTHRAQAWQKRP